MDFKINPCIKNFSLDEDNVCNLCSKRILQESELKNLDTCSYKGDICVQTSVRNLNDTYLSHPARVIRMAILIVFGSSLFTISGMAQDTIKNIQTTISEPTPVVKQFDIRGRIIDKENDYELPFVKVLIEGTEQGCYSDFDGYFKLSLKEYEVNPPISIRLSYLGYEDVVIDMGHKTTFMESEVIDLGTIEMSEDQNKIIVGIVIENIPTLDLDPDAHRSTKIGGDEIKKSPYRD